MNPENNNENPENDTSSNPPILTQPPEQTTGQMPIQPEVPNIARPVSVIEPTQSLPQTENNTNNSQIPLQSTDSKTTFALESQPQSNQSSVNPNTVNQQTIATPNTNPVIPNSNIPIQNPIDAAMPKPHKSKMKLIIIIASALIALMIGIMVLIFVLRASQKSAGLKKADEFIGLLEQDNKDELQKEVLAMLNIDEQTTSPDDLKQVTNVAIQTSFVANVLKNVDAERYSDAYGATIDGKKLVTAYYKFPVSDSNDGIGYYVVSVRKEDSNWVLNSLKFDTADPAK